MLMLVHVLCVYDKGDGGGAGSRETDWNDLIDEDFDYISVFLFFFRRERQNAHQPTRQNAL